MERKRLARRGTFVLATVGLTIAITGLVTAGAGGATKPQAPASFAGPITVAPSDALSVVESLGISVPAESCLAQPTRSGCPPVSKIVINPPVTGDGWVQLGPAQSSSTPASGAVTQANGVIKPSATLAGDCEYEVTKPAVYYVATSSAKNNCTTGGVTEQETWGMLSRWQNDEWATMNDCFTSSPVDGLQQCASTYDCLHPTTEFQYIGFVQAYAVILGIGYFGSGQSDTTISYCY